MPKNLEPFKLRSTGRPRYCAVRQRRAQPIPMHPPNPRILNAVSSDELKRRWQATRAAMRGRSIDALVVQNSSDWVGGYIRWFTNQPATNGYPSSLVFPLDDAMSFIEQGPLGGLHEARPDEARDSGIARRLTTPSTLSTTYLPPMRMPFKEATKGSST